MCNLCNLTLINVLLLLFVFKIIRTKAFKMKILHVPDKHIISYILKVKHFIAAY